MSYLSFSVTPDSVNFGTVRAGNSKKMSVVLTVRTLPAGLDAPLKVNILPPLGIVCSVQGLQTINNAGGALYVELTWTPSSTGNLDTYLEIDNVTQGGYKLIHLTGTCPVQPARGLLVWPLIEDLGVTPVGTTSAQPYTVANTQDASGDLTILSATIVGGEGAFTNDVPLGYPFSMGPGQWVSLPIYFTPTHVGMYTAALQITHDDASLPSPFTVMLIGKGTDLYTFTSDEYLLKDKSKVRVTFSLHHKGAIAGYVDGNLSSYDVVLSDPGEGDMQTDLGELVTYPATRKFTMDDPQGFLSTLLIEDDDIVGDIFVTYERQKFGEETWVTKISGVLDYPVDFNDDSGDNSLTFNVSIGTDILSKLAFGDFFNPPGYDLDGPGFMVKFPTYSTPRYGRLSRVPKKTLGATENLVGLLNYIFSVVGFVTAVDESAFNASLFDFSVDVPGLYADDAAGTNPVTFSDINLVSSGLWIYSDQGKCTMAEFLHSLCIGYGIRIEVQSASTGTIRGMFRSATSVTVPIDASGADRDGELHLHHAKSSTTSMPVSGVAAYYSGTDATVIGLMPTGDFLDVCSFVISHGYLDATKAPNFGSTQRDTDNLQVVIPVSNKHFTNMLDGVNYLPQSQAAATFWWNWLSGRKGNRLYLLTAMGLDYGVGSVITFRGHDYFPTRVIERDKDCETDFELIKVS